VSGAQSRLPSGFEALEPFVDAWAVAGAANRAQTRLASSETDRESFYAVAKDLLAPALTFLDKKKLAEFDEKERRLMNLMLSLAHVSLAVEQQRDHEARHGLSARYLTITRAPSDQHA
jgi:hypothetical protein